MGLYGGMENDTEDRRISSEVAVGSWHRRGVHVVFATGLILLSALVVALMVDAQSSRSVAFSLDEADEADSQVR
jgi:hypothetical protein